MVEEWSDTSDRNNLKATIILVIVAVSIISVAAWVLSTSWALPPTLATEQQTQHYTASYAAIDPEAAYELVFNNSNPLTIIDIRPCDCSYNNGHIPKAIWQTSPATFYETTNDLLIYCDDGQLSITFCEGVLNHTYGAIYYLDGGIKAWEEAGYRITKL